MFGFYGGVEFRIGLNVTGDMLKLEYGQGCQTLRLIRCRV